VYPEPTEDKLDLGDNWCRALSRAWDRTHNRQEKVELVPWILQAIEWLWQQAAAAGVCRAEYSTKSYEFCQALAYISPEEGIPHMKWASEFLHAWPECGGVAPVRPTATGCRLCSTCTTSPRCSWTTTGGRDPETVRKRYAAAMQWLQPMAEAGLTDELGQVGSETFYLMDRASLWDEAVEVAMLCIDNGVHDFGIADRLALILERKVADPEACMALCRRVDTWPVGKRDQHQRHGHRQATGPARGEGQEDRAGLVPEAGHRVDRPRDASQRVRGSSPWRRTTHPRRSPAGVFSHVEVRGHPPQVGIVGEAADRQDRHRSASGRHHASVPERHGDMAVPVTDRARPDDQGARWRDRVCVVQMRRGLRPHQVR
jgi:hypothetical protein